MGRVVVCVAIFVALVAGPLVQTAAGQTGVREVSATERGVISLQTRLRYTTMVVLPEGEEILDVLCGDRDFWVISATHNIAHVKPAKAGAETNLESRRRQRDDLFVLVDGEVEPARSEGLCPGRRRRGYREAEVLLGGASRDAGVATRRGSLARCVRASGRSKRRSPRIGSSIHQGFSSRTARRSTRSRSSSAPCGTTVSSRT